MNRKIWDRCLTCEKKCCEYDVVQTVFVTPEEKKRLPGINTQTPCPYYNKENKLCSVHKTRPLDCRIFPFDIIKIDNKYVWVVWDMNYCPILKEERDKFEEYLEEIEKNVIPGLKNHIKEFDEWKDDEYKERYKYKVLREVKL